MVQIIAGVILAGGSGRRLGGVEKSALQFAGAPLLGQVYAQVVDQGREWALASDGYRPVPCPSGLQVLADPFTEKRGPLAGLLAAYGWAHAQNWAGGCRCGFLLSVPVDTPFFPQDFTLRAREHSGAGKIVMGRYGDDRYPTAALWPMAALEGLEAWLATTENLSIRAYMNQFDVEMIDYIGAQANPFENINTPDDLAQLEKRAQR